MSKLRIIAALAAIASLATAVQAQEAGVPTGHSAFVLGGQFTTAPFGESFSPFTVGYEGNFLVGGGWRGETIRWDNGVSVGLEAGAALRVGEGTSLEAWAGPYLRHDGVVIADTVTISPSLTFGLSAVTGTMGTEREREEGDNASAAVLFYLSPELAFSTTDNPDVELFWRLHHRSGAWGTLGGGSANATTLGLRVHF